MFLRHLRRMRKLNRAQISASTKEVPPRSAHLLLREAEHGVETHHRRLRRLSEDRQTSAGQAASMVMAAVWVMVVAAAALRIFLVHLLHPKSFHQTLDQEVNFQRAHKARAKAKPLHLHC
mmetsp:Transcript_5857/g.12676  ORF Transcript_5857/g.12676 Transcript_5857/m.12676 type:complete len:120 (-) Transcript_5857:535-894(-)